MLSLMVDNKSTETALGWCISSPRQPSLVLRIPSSRTAQRRVARPFTTTSTLAVKPQCNRGVMMVALVQARCTVFPFLYEALSRCGFHSLPVLVSQADPSWCVSRTESARAPKSAAGRSWDERADVQRTEMHFPPERVVCRLRLVDRRGLEAPLSAVLCISMSSRVRILRKQAVRNGASTLKRVGYQRYIDQR
jgi:hypothetical protein